MNRLWRGVSRSLQRSVQVTKLPRRFYAEEAVQREQMQFDVVIVGAGPAGLSAAIKIKQMQEKMGKEVSVCVVEKGSEPGAHILSGACFDPIALDELIPDWKEKGAPVKQPVTKDQFLYLTEKLAIPSVTLPSLDAHGCYVISLSKVVRWLAERAQEMGVEIIPGFAAAEPLYNLDGSIRGVQIGDMGVGKGGEKKESYTPGVELLGKQTIFCEGCRGSITQKLYANKNFNLYAKAQAQTYALGIKEVWIVQPEKHQPGLVLHTGGWPLTADAFGGSFLYHDVDNRVYVGFVVGLDYHNPWLSIYDEFQRFKTHPAIRRTFEGGECIAYGARTITEGGLQCLPKLTMPGAMIAGDNGGTLIAARIKGVHTAMKAGMLAGEAVMNKIDAVMNAQTGIELTNYTDLFKQSWLYQEMYKYRNFRPAVNNYGFYIGSCIIALDQFIFRGNMPFTMKFAHEGDHKALKPASQCKKIDYPKYDNKITFDLLTNLIRSGTSHEEDQPVHLHIKDLAGMKTDNFDKFAGPEGRFCPAKVYEWLEDDKGKTYLQINASNCLHCKACSIKDYGQRIDWRVPQGGGGPQYQEL